VVPTDYLPEGVLMLTLTTLENLPLSERLVYIERKVPLKIQIVTDKSQYKKREPVTLKISLQGDSIIEGEGNASLAVVDAPFTNNSSQFPTTISSWFLLESDIHGNIEDPSYYFDPTVPDRLEKLDLLLLTQGWRDFAWKYDSINFPAENGFTISGKLIKNKKNKPLEDSRVSIGIFGGNNTKITAVPVDSSGRFNLSGIDLTGEASLIVSGIDKKDCMAGTIIIDSLTYTPAVIRDSLWNDLTLTGSTRGQLRTFYKINEAIRVKYKLYDTISLGEVNIISEIHKDPQTLKVEKSRSKYGTPDGELIITQQMESYPYLAEVMRGRMPGVEVTGSYPNFKIMVRNPFSFLGSGAPLVLVDGSQGTFEDLIYIPVSLIDRIDVLKSAGSSAIFGIPGYNGVINLITKAGGETEVYSQPINSAKLRISGYNAPRIFYSPQHLPNSHSDLNPDLRYTLLWNPDINLNSNKEIMLDYCNGDNSSLIRIIAEGITKNGIPVTGTAEYEVR
jgi:hypothetical protein